MILKEFTKNTKTSSDPKAPSSGQRHRFGYSRMLRLGCAALALALAAGAIPFLRSFAAEEETAVSGSDLVSGSDAVSAFSGTVEPKTTHAAIGGMDWVRMNSLDDLSNATLASKSTFQYQDIVNWINAGYLNEFL